MVVTCAASAKLALPALMHNVFRSQFASDLASSTIPYRFASRPPFSSQNQRPFSSITYLRDPQSEQSAQIIPESPVTNASTPSDKPRKQFSGAPRNKNGWKPMKSHPRKPENEYKRSDRERKAFRTETRKEARKEDRKDSGKDSHGNKDSKSASSGKKKKETWQVQKAALEKKFPQGWNPPKKLSPDALDGIRHLHAKAPEQFTTPVLAKEFEVSPEAIRRILKSRWQPSEDEQESRRQRWEKRHDRIWSRMAELGLRPETKRTKSISDARVLYGDESGRK
ncbi:hypothetical protein PENANT_c026G08424 [Penicillium antarcticum]|uniref:Required for respiratory growth protein 9, mitochondrial n=1 Tax=Penicillium antarcticum TaxID=416450 RepID=A0A1V6PWY3_9EURO|nr:uncharacterized protein N7508_000115 [Penicillium antarcticum]KAJ5319832.1 hypothetical protein N7508_000115 [Penicillium antarcticum]OQD81538.1 hypothetical protein PENANT_c026G08424 [Penicillium antarcticum]